MSIKVTTTEQLPNANTAFYRPAAELRTNFDELKTSGKLVSITVEFDNQTLTKNSVIVWKDEQAYMEFLFDSVVKQRRSEQINYNQLNGITRTVSVTTI